MQAAGNWRPCSDLRTYTPSLHRFVTITPHPFRHGAIAAWVEAGITDGYKISRYLGHGTPTSAYRRYGHLLPNDESEVTARLSVARAKAEAEVAGVGWVPALLALVGAL